MARLYAEELFTLTTDDDERRHFIDLLVTAVSEPRGPLIAIVTLRADFYDRPMRYPSLVPLLVGQSRLIPLCATGAVGYHKAGSPPMMVRRTTGSAIRWR